MTMTAENPPPDLTEIGRGPLDIAVIGAGSWGTAIAILLWRNGHRVRLWSYEDAVAGAIRERGENEAYLPGVPVPRRIAVTTRLDDAVSGAQLVVSVIPAQFVSAIMSQTAPHLRPDALVVSASKGIEIETLRTMDQVFSEILPSAMANRLVALSGPSFAAEVANQQPTAVVAASRSRPAAEAVQRAFGSDAFRVYTSTDIVGVELGGALKNVVALAAGVCAGLDFGHNAQAALITRGLAEITRLGVTMGAQASTFSGLAGIGDLVLTCTGEASRNRSVGIRLGKGEPLGGILADMRAVAEGVRTAPAAYALAHRHGVEMPIVDQIHAVLEARTTPSDAVRTLMSRDPRPESDADVDQEEGTDVR